MNFFSRQNLIPLGVWTLVSLILTYAAVPTYKDEVTLTCQVLSEKFHANPSVFNPSNEQHNDAKEKCENLGVSVI